MEKCRSKHCQYISKSSKRLERGNMTTTMGILIYRLKIMLIPLLQCQSSEIEWNKATVGSRIHEYNKARKIYKQSKTCNQIPAAVGVLGPSDQEFGGHWNLIVNSHRRFAWARRADDRAHQSQTQRTNQGHLQRRQMHFSTRHLGKVQGFLDFLHTIKNNAVKIICVPRDWRQKCGDQNRKEY